MPPSSLSGQKDIPELGSADIAAINAYVALLKLKKYSHGTIPVYRTLFSILQRIKN